MIRNINNIPFIDYKDLSETFMDIDGIHCHKEPNYYILIEDKRGIRNKLLSNSNQTQTDILKRLVDDINKPTILFFTETPLNLITKGDQTKLYGNATESTVYDFYTNTETFNAYLYETIPYNRNFRLKPQLALTEYIRLWNRHIEGGTL